MRADLVFLYLHCLAVLRKAKTVEEAIEMATEAISVYIESLEEDGEPIPDDSKSLEYSLTLIS